MEDQFDVTPEVVVPEIVTEEAVIPQTDGEVTPEITTPEKIEQTPEENAKFKELRLKHEKELSDKQAEWEQQLADIKKQNEELLPLKQKAEEETKANALRQFAEANGLTYEEAVEIAADEEEKETLKSQLTAKETREQELSEQLKQLENDLAFEKMYRSDKDSLRAIDPTVDIDNLSESYWKFRVTGLTAEEALSAVRTKEGLIEKAPVIGKIGKENPTSDITEDEYDNMSDAQQKAWFKKDPKKAWELQKGWLNK